LVWALTELMVERQSGLLDYYRQLALGA